MSILKFKLQKEINCYLSNAYYLCVILAYDNMKQWFYENYIQLFFSTNKALRNSKRREIFLDFYGGWTEPQHLFDCIKYDREFMQDSNVIEFMKKNIDNGRYIYTYIDEYYTIQSEHNSHDVFIYGYDDNEENILVAGFNQKWVFTSYTVKYETFLKAYKNGLDNSKKNDTYGGINYAITMLPKFNENTIYKFNVDKFLSLFYDYIHSINTSEKIQSNNTDYDMYKVKTNVYGMDVYDKLIKEIKYIQVVKVGIDYRAFHAIAEHKYGLLMRIKNINEIYHLNLKDEIFPLNICNELVKISKEARYCVIKYLVSGELAPLNKALEKIEMLKKIETESFEKIYDFIKENTVI